MASKIRLKYPWRIFMLLLGVAWLTVVSFIAFQYTREKQYKAEQLNARMQLFNHYILNGIEDGRDIDSVIETAHMPVPDTRISIIDREGNVRYDNSTDTLPKGSHITRPEIVLAINNGSGYTVRRQSESTGSSYFYSATAGDSVIVRSAAPYSVTLQEILAADRTFLWFMLAVTIIISTIGYVASRKIGLTISRLNQFAEKAERGERIYQTEPFPHDELGDIANHIVRLYAQLQHAIGETEREHRMALQQEQDKIRIKKDLTNNINHELKTPVASMQVCIETLLEHEDLDTEKRREFLERCYANIERLRRLLNDVSIITRMDDGTAVINKESIDLCTVINEACSDFEPIAEEKGIKIENDVTQSLPMKGNESLLHSVFHNLIDNAIAYSGGDKVSIRLIDETETRISLMVADNGIGVPPEHLLHIFERFYRIDKGRSRRAGGTGLGLSIVKNAVLIHGGVITAENRPGGGLAFRISLAKS